MSAALTRNTITLAKRASVGGWVNARSTSSLKIAVAPTEKRSKTFVYNDVIWQHFEAKRYDQARFVFDDLLIDGVLPTDRTFHNLMTNAAVWNSPPFQVEEIISEMKLRGFAPSSIVYLMTMGNFLQHKQYLNVIKVYRDMKRLGANHSHRTYMCVIEAFAKSLMIDEAREVIDAMKQHGLQPDDKAYAHLIDACSQLDDKPRALMFFDELESSGTPLTSTVYNAVFQILKGDFNGLMQAYGHMKDREVVPNTVVFNTLVTACMKFQQWDHALEFVREYVSKHNMVYSRPLAATVLSVPLTEKSIEFLHHVVVSHNIPFMNWLMHSIFAYLCRVATLHSAPQEAPRDFHAEHSEPGQLCHHI
eukprot:c11604_g1_i2.p1 GENE.c11604_g1_i2~~c11604_g1_i2.p1  ORF type:complete len:362 (-),score=74.56 c11604_g1_i2:603-1688(-)